MGWREDAAASAKRDASFRQGLLGRSDGTFDGDMGVALQLKPVQTPFYPIRDTEPAAPVRQVREKTWWSIPRPSAALWRTFAIAGAIVGALYGWLALQGAGPVVAGWAVAGAVTGATALIALALTLWLLKLALALAFAAGLFMAAYYIFAYWTHADLGKRGSTPTIERLAVKPEHRDTSVRQR